MELDRDDVVDSIWCHFIKISTRLIVLDSFTVGGGGHNGERNRQNSIIGGTRYHRDGILTALYVFIFRFNFSSLSFFMYSSCFLPFSKKAM